MSDMPVSDKPPAPRAAIAMVIIMSVLVVLALLGVVWGFVKQAQIVMAHRAAAPVAAVSPGAAAAVVLAPGSHIISAATDSGKLVLHVSTPSGGEVEIIDLATGRLTGQVRTH